MHSKIKNKTEPVVLKRRIFSAPDTLDVKVLKKT